MKCKCGCFRELHWREKYKVSGVWGRWKVTYCNACDCKKYRPATPKRKRAKK